MRRSTMQLGITLGQGLSGRQLKSKRRVQWGREYLELIVL